MKKEIKKIKFLALTVGTCAAALFAPTHNVHAENFTAEQKQELEVLFKKFLADNPQSILDSVDSYRAAQEEKTQQSAAENLKKYDDYFKDNTLPIAGNPNGDVTVVEYFDYNCGYCRKAFADIQTLLNEDTNLRVIFQEMPILSPSSQTMAAISMAAHKQGKYFEMHKALMDYRGTQSEEAYNKVAKDVGVDVEQMNKDAASEDVLSAITTSSDMARDLGIRGTPGFIIGDKLFPGYIGLDGLRNAIKEARAANTAK